jgi:hypothetical protein
MQRVEHDLDPAQWSALVDAWGGCAYCGASDRPLQKDCVMALSRGGRYTLDNIVPACRSCNASKCNDEVTSWMRRKRLDERRFLVRYAEISRALVTTFDDREFDDGELDDGELDGTDSGALTVAALEEP